MAEQITINRSKTAVIAMDFQMRQLSFFPKEFQDDIIARAKKVLARARQDGMLIINVEVQRGERTPETAIHPAMIPPPGELLLTKRKAGPFSTTNLNEVLQKRGIDTLVLMGLRTMGCVLTAVRWAVDIDYRVIVLSDCCADQDAEVHRVLMEKVFPWQASVITSQEFLQILSKPGS